MGTDSDIDSFAKSVSGSQQISALGSPPSSAPNSAWDVDDGVPVSSAVGHAMSHEASPRSGSYARYSSHMQNLGGASPVATPSGSPATSPDRTVS